MTSQRLAIEPTKLAGAAVLRRIPVQDSRGWFERLFCIDELAILGAEPIVQINRSFTRRRGTVRGLHFQLPPHAEIKIVTCLRGSVFDVAVDLRQGSPTFLQWHGELLSADSGTSLYIPKGFAHGFQTMSPDCELLYMHSARYSPASESGIHPTDPSVAVAWPEPVTELSDRDTSHRLLDENYLGIKI